jgi:DNA-binding NtrC family response regulator
MTQASTIAAPHLVGANPAHVQLLKTLDRVSLIDVEVLITGPTGVGKELYAGYIRQHSLRAKAPIVPVNCAALPPDLIENELFGHIGGAFNGARPQSTRLVAEAEGARTFRCGSPNFRSVIPMPIACRAPCSAIGRSRGRYPIDGPAIRLLVN